jgi:hypothetical protein
MQAGVQERLVVLAGGVEILQQAEPASAVQIGQPGFDIRPRGSRLLGGHDELLLKPLDMVDVAD